MSVKGELYKLVGQPDEDAAIEELVYAQDLRLREAPSSDEPETAGEPAAVTGIHHEE